jgi:hypothetical protein
MHIHIIKFLIKDSNCRVICIAAMDLISRTKRIKEFDIYVNIACTFEIELDSVEELLSGFDVDVKRF